MRVWRGVLWGGRGGKAGVFRGYAVYGFGGRDSEAGAGGDYFVGWAKFSLRQGCAGVRSGGACAGDSGVGDLLRHAVDGEESGWKSGAGRAAGIRASAFQYGKG